MLTALAFIVVLAIAIGIAMLLSAVLIGVTGAWFLDVSFSSGWEAAWDKPLLLLAYVLVAGFLVGAASK